jgi:hypothetical protein
MTELNLAQLFYLVEMLLRQRPDQPLPLIQRSRQAPYSFWLSGLGAAAPLDALEYQRLDQLVGTLSLQPWHMEQDFSDEIIIYLRGNAAELERHIGQLFELEHGLWPRFTLTACLLGQIQDRNQYACLLYLKGLHSYLPFVSWQKQSRCVIYYRYGSTRESGPAERVGIGSQARTNNVPGIYVQWGYELPADVPGLDRDCQGKNLVVLLGQDLLDRYVLKDAEFFPLLDLLNLNVEVKADVQIVTPPPEVPLGLQLNIGPLRESETQDLQTLSESSLLKFNMTLRSVYDSMERFEADTNALEGQIEYLQLQLEKVRLDREVGGFSLLYLYVYEELPQHPYADGLDGLRQFVVRQPEWHLANFAYQYLTLQLGSAKRFFHLVRPLKGDWQNPAGLNPPASTYRFYLEQQWSSVMGCDIYLPMDGTSRPMEFYPALLPSKKMAEKFKPALLGKDFQPGSTLLLWPDPWPDRQTIKTMFKVAIPKWESLLYAQQFINIRAIKEESDAIKQPSDSLSLVRDRLYGGPLPDQQLPEQQAISQVQTDWVARKKVVDTFISNANRLLAQAAQAEKYRAEVIALLYKMRKLRKQKFKDWNSFMTTVRHLHQEVMEYSPTLKTPFDEILNNISAEQLSNEAKLEQLISRFQREVGSNDEYRGRVAARLRRLADDLAPANSSEVTGGRTHEL